MPDIVDRLTLRRVANGWVIRCGSDAVDQFTHIATTPAELAQHVEKWAAAQIATVA